MMHINKGHIAALMLSLAMLAGCSGEKARVTGLVTGGHISNLALKRLDVNRTTFIDSVRVDQSGRFAFSTRLEEPELYILSEPGGSIINLLLFPGDRINLRTEAGTFNSSYQVEGSEESENIRTLVKALQATRTTLDSLSRRARELGDEDSLEMEEIQAAFAQAIIQQKRFTIRYLVEHPGSLSSVYALYQKYSDGSAVMGAETDLQYFKFVSDSVNAIHPNSSLAISLSADISKREAESARNSSINRLLELADREETGLIDLNIPDRDGNEQRLSSLKGKVILVCFWASWDANSISSLLQLRPVYNKYKAEGFEVYAVSLDRNKTQWMSAMDFNEFGWINVCELTYPESEAAVRYNVSSLPTNFLINRHGEIMARNLHGRTLETWLNNLLHPDE